MNNDLIIKKIQALLHDPPEKPMILGKIGHEGRAKELMSELGLIVEAIIPPDVKTADHIASAADRINFPKDEHFVADFCGKPVIKHPLSAEEFDLKKLPDDINNITATVDRAIVALESKYSGDRKRLYLALWRELLGSLIDKRNDVAKLGQLWELLPADTRIPDHSIWEHKRVTSAIAGALPNLAFLLFAIGPVQEFIATARKTQDLWAGSYLLSYLSWSAIKVVAEEFGPDSIIFPDLCGQPFADKWLISENLKINEPSREELSSPTLPNRLLAIVPEDSVKDIAEKAKQAVENTFKEVSGAVKAKMSEILKVDSSEWNGIWQRQISDFIETYWAAVPVYNYADFLNTYKPLIGSRPDDEFEKLLKEYEAKGFTPNIGTVYGQIYRLTEKTLGSRKAIRDFKQTDEPNHKCTLCGLREPVHPEMHNHRSCSEDFGALRGFWQEKVLPAFPQIRKSERLCAVCVTKRLSSKHCFKDALEFDINDNFPSVSMVATASFKLRVIENLANNDLKTNVDLFVKSIKSLASDRWSGIPMPMVIRACRDEISKDFAKLEGDWLYRETLEDKTTLWEENKSRMSENDFDNVLSTARKKHKELFNVIEEIDKTLPEDKRIGKPSTYYAVLLMDGDNMGKWLSGEYAPTIADVLHPIVKNTLEYEHNWQRLLKQKRPLNPSLHLATSKALRDFSLHVAREIVEKDHLGKLVYAGGDDVLAFVSLRDLPEVMRKLRAYFSGSLLTDEATNKVDIDFQKGKGFVPIDESGEAINVGSGKPIKGFMLSMGTNATASMGVVIAHHNSNLSQVLDEVRKCEKQAKKIEGKNSFCIALAKRAGGTEYTQAKWYYKTFYFESIPLLRQWADAFYKDWISPKFVYTFRTETKGLEGLEKKAIELELIRIANRQRAKSLHKMTDNEFKKIADWAMTSDKKDIKDNVDRMREFYENGEFAKVIKLHIVFLVDGLMNLHKHGLSLADLGKFLSLAAFLGREDNR